MNITFKISVILAALALCFSSAAQCDLPTSKGNDFWVAFLWNNGEEIPMTLTLTALSDTTATMTVENPRTGWSTTVTLTASAYSNIAYAEITIPLVHGENVQASTPSSHGFHITSDADIWLTAQNHRLASVDAASILPTAQLGTRYIVQDYPNTTSSGSATQGGCEVVILATEDNTVVDMVLPCSTQPATVAPGNLLSVTLQRGQTYLLVTPTPNQFSGMEINSNGKPFALFQGNRITSVPNGYFASGDHIYEQAVPVEAWGTDFIATATYGRSWGDIVRITAADSLCTISVNGTVVTTLAPFGSHDYHMPANSTNHIHTSTRASATLIMPSSTWNAEYGDVSSLTLTPLDGGVCNAMFRLTSTTRCNTFYVAVATAQANVSGMTLDGNSIASQFSGSGSYRHALISVSEGNHRLNCNNGTFTAYAYAQGNVESYAFSLPRSFANYVYDTIAIYDTACQGQPVDTIGIHLASNVTLHPGDTILERDIIRGIVHTHVFIHLTVMPTYNTSRFDTINYGDTLWIDGTAFTTPGTYVLTLTSVYGCDSTVCIRLTVPTDTIELCDTVCQGHNYTGYGFSIANVIHDTTMVRDTIEGRMVHCLRLHLTVTPTVQSDIYRSIILGDTLIFGDTALCHAGAYTFHHTANNGCDSIVVLHLEYEHVNLGADKDGICPGEEVVLTASGTHTFQWSSTPPDPELVGQQGMNPIVVHPTTTTVYYLVDAAGNLVSSTTVGTEPAPTPCIEVNHKELDFDNPALTFHDCSEGRHHTLWIFSDSSRYVGERIHRIFNHPLPDSVTVTMTTCNRYDCCAGTTISLPMKIRSVWFPNVFTPDADNNNLFQCYTSFDVAKFSLVIYNRWGFELWSSEDINEPWDGRRADGTPCVQGAYVYRYWITATDGRFDSNIGTITLLR